MQIDFHFGITYIVSRVAGFKKDEAYKIAYSAQFVDDAIHEGLLQFRNRSSYAFIASAHKMLDYRNFEELANKYVWIPFHFLPGNKFEEDKLNQISKFEQRLVCKPNSEVAQNMVQNCIENNDKRFGLHLLGITMHVYADTWAHQGFCGVTSKLNTVEEICNFSGERDQDMHQYLEEYYSGTWWQKALRALGLYGLFERIQSQFVSKVNPIGHGSVLSYPDLPFKKWKYRNWNGELVTRDNPTDFFEAIQHMYKVMKQFRGEEINLDSVSEDLNKIKYGLTEIVADSGEQRLGTWLSLIEQGHFSFGAEKIRYRHEGEDSWLYQGLGFLTDKEFKFDHLDYPEDFMKKDWKLLHDALAFHRFSILNVVLPRFGISTN